MSERIERGTYFDDVKEEVLKTRNIKKVGKNRHISTSEDYPVRVRLIGEEIEISQSDLDIQVVLRIGEVSATTIGKQLLSILIQIVNALKSNRNRARINERPMRLSRLSSSPYFWTVTEFAETYQISEATVKRMCARGELDAKKIASRWRITGKPI